MKSFDEWYFELFESGKGVKLNQQEIANEAWDSRQDEIDELQKRIDFAIEYLDECYSSCDIDRYTLVQLLQGETNEH